MMIHQQAAAQKLGELFLEARNFRDHWKHVSNGKSPQRSLLGCSDECLPRFRTRLGGHRPLQQIHRKVLNCLRSGREDSEETAMKITKCEFGEGTCLQGYVTTNYLKLCSLFGAPSFEGDKSSVDWCVKIDGHVVTIYDYYDHCTKDGSPHEFHIGGESKLVVALVRSLV